MCAKGETENDKPIADGGLILYDSATRVLTTVICCYISSLEKLHKSQLYIK